MIFSRIGEHIAHHELVVGSGVGLLPSFFLPSACATCVPQAQTLLQRQIEAADRQIDRLVYELYGLTEEEITIVERGIH